MDGIIGCLGFVLITAGAAWVGVRMGRVDQGWMGAHPVDILFYLYVCSRLSVIKIIVKKGNSDQPPLNTFLGSPLRAKPKCPPTWSDSTSLSRPFSVLHLGVLPLPASAWDTPSHPPHPHRMPPPLRLQALASISFLKSNPLSLSNPYPDGPR